MVTVGMSDVNSCEILAALHHPGHQLLRMLLKKKRINQDGIAFPINERYGIRDPGEIFLARWNTLGSAIAFFGKKLPVQSGHTFPLGWIILLPSPPGFRLSRYFAAAQAVGRAAAADKLGCCSWSKPFRRRLPTPKSSAEGRWQCWAPLT